MIVGDKSLFAIDSKISVAYNELSSRALGYFVLYILGKRYGVCDLDATLLACSFDEIENRLRRRGDHIAPFSTYADSAGIAKACYNARYGNDDNLMLEGMSPSIINRSLKEGDLFWAPDGDEAFDDGSFVLQLDIGSQVRIIAFKIDENARLNLASLSDLWIEGDVFYTLIKQWREEFLAEWKTRIITDL